MKSPNDNAPDELDKERGLAPFRGLVNGFIFTILLYSGAFFIIKWLKRSFLT